MSFLLFPGRHLVNTRFQQSYLQSLLGCAISALNDLSKGSATPEDPITEIIFAITSSNQENSRYNPIPFHIRAIGVDRFARELQNGRQFRYRIFGIPHYGHTKRFADFTIKEIADQSEQIIQLTPRNTIVLCSTPEVSRLYEEQGFSILPGEAGVNAICPIDVIRQLGAGNDRWENDPFINQHLSPSSASLFRDFPEVPARVRRMYCDPLTTQDGSLTAKRNYNTYARGMNEIVRLKYKDIKSVIKPGRIVDEGCADGALLAEISQDFQDSDLFGVGLSAEFAARFQERQRTGDFSGTYVHFLLRNLLDRIFQAESIDTTICNSTLHELWSYADQKKSVLNYLNEKHRQLREGGRLVIRDVVGPENGGNEIFLWCSSVDGADLDREQIESHSGRSSEWLSGLSSRSRFFVFAKDFLPKRRPGNQVPYREAILNEKNGFIVSLTTAAEFLSKKDYTDNWSSEMNEEFCFWGFSHWKQAIAEVGFRVLENPNEPQSGSRIYTNPWIVQHRYESHAALFDAKSGECLPYPPTNMVLVAEKII